MSTGRGRKLQQYFREYSQKIRKKMAYKTSYAEY